MSLNDRYVNALRQKSRAQDTYVCVICKQQTAVGRSAFLAHIDSVHSDVAAEGSSKEAAFDLQVWRDSIESRSKTSGNSVAAQQQPGAGRATTEVTQPGTPAQAMKDLSLESGRKKSSNKKLLSRNERPAAEPGGSLAKRPRSVDDVHQRSTKSQSKSNPRKAVPRGNAQDQSSPVSRQGTFHSNWNNNQPTRELFNPANSAAGAGAPQPAPPQVTLPSRSAAATSPDASNQTSPNTAAKPQPSNASTKERGVLPMPAAVVSEQSFSDRVIAMPTDARWPGLLMQPDSRPISQEQLAAEVKSIYAGLTMVESKCIHVDKAQAIAIREQSGAPVTPEHWQALIALHRTLLHEHHDFFLASQHPSASQALRRLASKYSMPARMWKHGIHSFLELLRYRLPESLEFMTSFIYTAYQMMSLLYETVPAFKNTWIECLGDLGRYRMAIEDEDLRDRENWAGVSRSWYQKAADASPEVGRLYHHLAILARPNALQQLSLYSRSLISVQIFSSARESIMTLFNPYLGRAESASSQVPQIDAAFVRAHALLFLKEQPETFKKHAQEFLNGLDANIARVSARWREHGAWIIIALFGSLFDYGNDSPMRRIFDLGFHFKTQRTQALTQDSEAISPPTPAKNSNGIESMEAIDSTTTVDKDTQIAFDNSLWFFTQTLKVVLLRQGDKNTLPFVHLYLAFLHSLSDIRFVDARIQNAYVAGSLFKYVPREELVSFLNTLARFESAESRYESNEFVRPEKGDYVPLPEDHLIRGQAWSQDYFPVEFFKAVGTDDEEKNIEHASTVRMRAERVLNLGFRLSSMQIGIGYHESSRSWFVGDSLSQPYINTNDVVMSDAPARQADAESGYESDNDSPENKTLLQASQAQAVPVSDDGLLTPASGKTIEADDILSHGTATLVCDEHLILYEQDMLRMLIQRRWKLVVSDKVVSDLSVMSNTSKSADSEAAREALKQLRDAYTHTDLKIINSQGIDYTKEHFSQDLPSGTIAQDAKSIEDPQENLIRVARRATEMVESEKAGAGAGVKANKGRSTILLTEDRRTRLLAAKDSIMALAPSVLKKYLDRGSVAGRSGGTSQSSGTVMMETGP